MNLQGTTALVTGANRGIGRALVAALLERGARRVYAAARKTDALKAVVDLDPSRVVALSLDVSDRAAIGTLPQRVQISSS